MTRYNPMIRLLMSKVQADDGTNMKEEDDSEDDDEFDKDKLSHKPKISMTNEWQQIHDAVVDVDDVNEDCAKLTHPSKNIFIFKRRGDGEVITRYFQDGCLALAENLRLRGSMFSHHMPWSYKGLFEGYGISQETVPESLVKSILNLS